VLARVGVSPSFRGAARKRAAARSLAQPTQGLDHRQLIGPKRHHAADDRAAPERSAASIA
jgi:hypothetical protein